MHGRGDTIEVSCKKDELPYHSLFPVVGKTLDRGPSSSLGTNTIGSPMGYHLRDPDRRR